MTVLTETSHAGAHVVSEANGIRSRDQVTVALSQTLVAGHVVGKIGVPAGETSSAAADAGNTGNGTLTLDVTAPVAAGAQNGVYRPVCIAVATNSGTFAVFDPQGVEIGRVVVGATFNNQIKFVIADGATDFVVGDAFSITVGRESGTDEQWKEYDPAATDGAQVAAGVLFDAITTDGASTKQGVVHSRACEIRASDITWKSGISAVNKAAGIEQLRAAGVILR
jgi:hypothetical protein